MEKYQVGDSLGQFLLLQTDGRNWSAKCTCGNIWETRLIRLKTRNNCPKCAPQRTFKHRKEGEIINGHLLLQRLPSKKWRCRCKCGAIRIASPCDLKRYDQCKECYDPERVAEQHRIPDDDRNLNYRFRYYRKAAANRSLAWELTKAQMQEFLIKDCTYCGKKNSQGIDRVDNNEGYVSSNCVSCCSFCNHTKKDYSQEDFLNHIKRIYEYQVQRLSNVL